MLVEACRQRRVNVIIILLCLEEAGGPGFRLHCRPGGCSLHFCCEFVAVQQSPGLVIADLGGGLWLSFHLLFCGLSVGSRGL